MGELLRALMFGKALKGVLTDVELLAATAVLEHERPHRRGCECEDCEDRLLLGLDPDDEW